jgi:putative endopeptidase
VLAKLDEAKTPQALLDASAALYAEGTGSFLGVFASQDKKDETKVALYLWQTGLSLPERAFYFSDEPATKRVRDAFPAHVAKMLGFLGYEAARAQQAGAAVLAFEVKLAEVSLPMVKLRNPDAHYHPMSWAEVDALTPGLRWEAATRRAGAPAVTRVIVGQPDFLKALARILAETPAADIRDYLRFQAISGYASILNATTAKAAFEFEGVVLTGAKQQRSLEERALKMQDGALGDLMGKEYVARRFSPAQRERCRNSAKTDCCRASSPGAQARIAPGRRRYQ